MRSMREFQLAFAAYAGGGPELWGTLHLRSGSGATKARGATHRSHTHEALADALAVIYPAVTSMIGEQLQQQTARQYLRAYPADGSDLRGFGRWFPEFLAELRPLRSLPYLPDVAHLEWARHHVQHALDDRKTLDLGALGRVRDADWARVRFSLHAATALVASPYPVLRIWQANLAAAPRQDVDLDDGGVQLLVARGRDYGVEVTQLPLGDYLLLQAFAGDRALESAQRLATLADPSFDLAGALSRFIQQSVITGFRPAPPARA